MRVLVCVAFCFSLLLCGCSGETVKTDPKSVTPATSHTEQKRVRDVRVD